MEGERGGESLERGGVLLVNKKKERKNEKEKEISLLVCVRVCAFSLHATRARWKREERERARKAT